MTSLTCLASSIFGLSASAFDLGGQRDFSSLTTKRSDSLDLVNLILDSRNLFSKSLHSEHQYRTAQARKSKHTSRSERVLCVAKSTGNATGSPYNSQFRLIRTRLDLPPFGKVHDSTKDGTCPSRFRS